MDTYVPREKEVVPIFLYIRIGDSILVLTICELWSFSFQMTLLTDGDESLFLWKSFNSSMLVLH